MRISLLIVTGLFVCIIGGVFLNCIVHAQGEMSPYIPLMSILFDEDPVRLHGLQAQSYCLYVDSGPLEKVATVPPDKRFIVTDLMVEGGMVFDLIHIWLATESKPANVKCVVKGCDNLKGSDSHVKLSTGITFEPNEEVHIGLSGTSSTARYVTISGYFVEL